MDATIVNQSRAFSDLHELLAVEIAGVWNLPTTGELRRGCSTRGAGVMVLVVTWNCLRPPPEILVDHAFPRSLPLHGTPEEAWRSAPAGTATVARTCPVLA